MGEQDADSKKVKNHSPLLAAVPPGHLLNLPVEVLCVATGGVKLHSTMALRKFGGAGPGGWGGRRAGRPKMPVGKMAKSDGIAEVQRLKNLLFRLRRKLC